MNYNTADHHNTKNLFYISLFHMADTTVYSKVRPTHTSERWPLHFSVLENNQVCDLKCLCLTWVLHCILYMYSPVYMRVPVVVTFRTPAFHMVAQTARHQGPKTIWINNHDSYEKCTHQKSLWSWFQPTTDSDIILTISVLTHWKRC